MKNTRIKDSCFKIAMAAVLVISTFTGCGHSSLDTNNGKSLQMQTLDSKLKTVAVPGHNNTTYQIFVGSYADSNGDGIGDLNGIRKKLDYIKDLGFNEIWLTPICPSPSYHKYDVVDYKAVDKQFGTMDDYDNLVKDAHKKGIKIINDMVINHSSDMNEWFRTASRYLKSLEEGQKPNASDCPYVDYYTFSKEEETGYHELKGSDWYYESHFSPDMPDLKLDNPAVKKEIEDIVKFWTDHGCDGFRCDAVAYYYWGNTDKNKEFMTWFAQTVKSIKPDAYLVGEAWVGQSEYADYYGSGFDSYFDFDFAGNEGFLANAVRGALNAKSYGKALVYADKLYRANDSKYTNGSFFTNHDIDRGAGYFAGEDGEKQFKLAYGLNFMRSGNAYLYYGDEIGMKGAGKDESKRLPMRWGDSKEAKSITTDRPNGIESYKMKYPNLEKQMKDDTSIYSYIKNATKLRNSSKALLEGTYEIEEKLSNKNILVMKKTTLDSSESVLVVINTSNKTKAVDLSKCKTIDGSKLKLHGVLQTSQDEFKLEGNRLTVPEYGIAVLK